MAALSISTGDREPSADRLRAGHTGCRSFIGQLKAGAKARLTGARLTGQSVLR